MEENLLTCDPKHGETLGDALPEMVVNWICLLSTGFSYLERNEVFGFQPTQVSSEG